MTETLIYKDEVVWDHAEHECWFVAPGPCTPGSMTLLEELINPRVGTQSQPPTPSQLLS
jgi:hypothetical protein